MCDSVCVCYESNSFPLHVLEALYEKKQAIMTYDTDIGKLQAQMEALKATSAEKDTFITKYEGIVKETKGEIIYYM